ncbi:MAG TPA: type II secretion system protein M [Gammaproteobacteria bacterium]|nr:type II secretion system protein M [Gammaproteobacteria bacterium]
MKGWGQITEYWEGLQPRERLMLFAGGIAVLFALVYFLLWQPVMNARTEMQQEVLQQRALLLWMKDAASEAKSLRGVTGQKVKGLGGQSLLSLVDQSAKQEGLGGAMKRVEPDGKQVRIWFEAASFDRLIAWLEKISKNNGIRVVSATIERADGTGLVDVRLRLAGGGG